MIATVRIASLEHWCDFYRKRFSAGRLPVIEPGLEVPIIVESCTVDPPDAVLVGHPMGSRWWRLAPEFVKQHNRPAHTALLCEHVLEMD